MSVLPFAIRAAVPADAPALAHLGEVSFVAKFGSLYRPADLAAFIEAVYTPAALAAELADPERRLAVAEAGDRLLAYVKLALTSTFVAHARGARPMELKQLYTAPDATGGGLGASLLAWAMQEARALGADELQLSVWSGNDGARRFYARHGFVRVADVPFQVGDQIDDDVLYARML